MEWLPPVCPKIEKYVENNPGEFHNTLIARMIRADLSDDNDRHNLYLWVMGLWMEKEGLRFRLEGLEK